MATQTTNGIKISVETFFQDNYSSNSTRDYMFAYKIRIENNNDFAVKLLTRHWFIFDASQQMSEVQGEGIVGKQPVLQPGQVHKYLSGCNLKSEIGKMWGNYTMQNLENQSLFKVEIPEFQLIAPFKLN